MTEETAAMLQRIFGSNRVPLRVQKAVSTAEFAMNRLQNKLRPVDIITICLSVMEERHWFLFGKPGQTSNELREQMDYEPQEATDPKPFTPPKPKVLSSQEEQEPMVVRHSGPSEATDNDYDQALQIGLKNLEKSKSDEPDDQEVTEPIETPSVVVQEGESLNNPQTGEKDPRDLAAKPINNGPFTDLRRWKDIKKGTNVKCELESGTFDGVYLGISSIHRKTLRVAVSRDPRNRKERRLHIKKVAVA